MMLDSAFQIGSVEATSTRSRDDKFLECWEMDLCEEEFEVVRVFGEDVDLKCVKVRKKR